jgi:hypothetical protein
MGKAGQAVSEPQDKVPVLVRSGTALAAVQEESMKAFIEIALGA